MCIIREHLLFSCMQCRNLFRSILINYLNASPYILPVLGAHASHYNSTSSIFKPIEPPCNLTSLVLTFIQTKSQLHYLPTRVGENMILLLPLCIKSSSLGDPASSLLLFLINSIQTLGSAWPSALPRTSSPYTAMRLRLY